MNALRRNATIVVALVALGATSSEPAMARRADEEPYAPAQLVVFPTTWTSLGTDPTESGCNLHRNVVEAFYALDASYLYLRLQNVDPAGWPDATPSGQARYKWFLDTTGDATLSGGNVVDAEYQLILEDLATSPDPTLGRNLLGELSLLDDLLNVGFTTRWGANSPPDYTTNAIASPVWRRVLGTGVAGTGGLQSATFDADIGYRITGTFVDMYVRLDLIGDPTSLRLLWSTDNHDNNLDQSPNCDRVDDGTFITILDPTPTPTSTSTPTDTPTSTPTNTPTNTPTDTPTSTPTNTPTNTPTDTPTSTPTNTPTNTPTRTPTNTPTNTPTRTPSNTPSATATPTSTSISQATEETDPTEAAAAAFLVGGEALGAIVPRAAARSSDPPPPTGLRLALATLIGAAAAAGIGARAVTRRARAASR